MNYLSRTAWTMIAIGALVIVAVDFQVAVPKEASAIELDVSESTANSQLQIYFDSGSGYRETDSLIRPLALGSGVQRLVFPLPEGHSLRSIRVDPLMTPGTVVLAEAKIVSPALPQGSIPLDLHRLAPLHEIASLVFRANTDALEIKTTPGSTDSQCEYVFDPAIWASFTSKWHWLQNLLPPTLSMIVIYLVALTIFGIATGMSPAAWWQSRRLRGNVFPRALSRAVLCLAVPLAFYAWLLILDLGRVPMLPEQEPSWVAVGTYAVAHHWRFGPEIILTYGPAMPLMTCVFIGSIDTAVFVGRLLVETWMLVLVIWLGLQLGPGRRWFFWIAAVTLGAGCLEQPLFYFSVVAAGLMYARRKSSLFLTVPTMVYLAALALIKVSYLMYVVFVFAAIGLELVRQRKWLAAAPALMFAVCYLLAWCLLGQHLGDLPLYLRGSLELVNGFSQAMSLPPNPVVLNLALVMMFTTVLQLASLFASGPRPRRMLLPLLGLLAGGLFLAWRAGFARADGHVFDWLVYAMVSAVAAPAFFPSGAGNAMRWVERGCAASIILAGIFCIAQIDPQKSTQLATMFKERWSSDLRAVTHPREVASDSRNVVLQSRAANALPRVRNVVGRGTVDVFCDEQAIAILNGLNYRPRPSCVNYSTYTPWLMNVDVAFYCSPQAPDYVLFKLESIDNRLPTLQNAPLLILLAKCYEPVLSENGYELFRRREQPRSTDAPAAFPLLAEGDISLNESLPLPKESPLWCELETRETPAGKLLKMFYQQPALDLEVTYQSGRVQSYRVIPQMDVTGFLINPLPSSTEEALRWMAGQPLEAVTSIHMANAPQLATVFEPKMHYKFYRAAGSIAIK